MNRPVFYHSSSTGRFVQRILVVIALALCCLQAACTSYKFENIKVTVTIEDNGVLYTGTSVQRLVCHGDIYIGGVKTDEPSCSPRGEAVPIRIGNKGWVFMILSGSRHTDFSLYGYSPQNYPLAIQGGRSRDNQSKAWRVPYAKAPAFVRFKDQNNRMTIEEIDINRFDLSFGTGVKLVSIDCELTWQPLTRGAIRKLLPWLDELGTSVIDLSAPGQPRSLISQLSRSNFVWE